MTGPLQNSQGRSTELWWWGCLCRDNPEPLPHRLPVAFPYQGTSEPGVFLGTSTTSWKKNKCLFRASALLPDVLGWRKGAAEPASWIKCASPAPNQTSKPQAGRRGCPQAPGAALRASEAVPARAGDAQETQAALRDTDGSHGRRRRAPSQLPCRAWVCTQPPLPEASPTCVPSPYIQQPGAPAIRGGVAGRLRSQALGEGGRGAAGSGRSCVVLGQ